jgi:hypothetical protein
MWRFCNVFALERGVRRPFTLPTEGAGKEKSGFENAAFLLGVHGG